MDNIILVDFDGTVNYQIPEPGEVLTEVPFAEKTLKDLIKCGNKIILWTARNNSLDNPFNYSGGKFRKETSLEEAIRWFKERDIELFDVNNCDYDKNVVGTSRKITGDILIDDMSIGTPLIYKNIDYKPYHNMKIIKTINTYCVDWLKIRELLKNKKLLDL